MPEVSQPLHLKYRPQRLEDVYGQKAITTSLKRLLRSDSVPHAYLFCGPSGCGKTTLARIAFKDLGCELIEIDAASNSGIDNMREVIETMRFCGLDNKPRGLILDEAHGLSRQAWDSLLKFVEEPPSHAFVALCTTQEGKVPPTIVSRCTSYTVKSLRRDDLLDLLEMVVETERMECSDPVLEIIAERCEGSARKALVMLEQAGHCKTDDEAAALLHEAEGEVEVIELARLVTNGRLQWKDMTRILRKLDMPAESIRIVLVNYITAALLKGGEDKRLVHALELLGTSFNPTDKLAPIVLALIKYMRLQ